MTDCEKHAQVKYLNKSYIQQIHVLHSIFKILWKSKHLQIQHMLQEVSLVMKHNKTKGKTIIASLLLNSNV